MQGKSHTDPLHPSLEPGTIPVRFAVQLRNGRGL